MNLCLVLHKYDLPLDDPCCYPLGFMYVSAILKAMGHNVKVLNHNLWDYDLAKEIEGQDAVLFTGFEEFLGDIRRDAGLCKEKGIRTILGGALATFRTELMAKYVDTVVVGEADEVLDRALKENGIIKGVKPDLKNLPYPDYEGFGIDEYNDRHPFRYMGVLASRGCPYHCRFCAHTCHYQARPLDQVFSEIDHYRNRYCASLFIFNDNTLNVTKDRFIEICKGMVSRGTWSCAIRVDVFDEEMAWAAKESGCIYMVVGIESFKQERLDMMNKGIRVEDVFKTLDLLHKYQINYHGNVLVGFEGDTYQDISEEVCRIPYGYNVYPTFVKPFVGTSCGKERAISNREYTFLDEAFRGYIERSGKYCYPDLKEAA